MPESCEWSVLAAVPSRQERCVKIAKKTLEVHSVLCVLSYQWSFLGSLAERNLV